MLEICVDNLESAIAASSAGCHRLELCSALSEGGLTPTPGFFQIVRKYVDPAIKLFAMIRCRRGNDFYYSDQEMEIMLADLEVLKSLGVDGFVFGALTENEEIHTPNCAKILKASGELPVTFHRAFDLTTPNNFSENCSHLADMGFDRLLTSGYHATAEAGLDYLKKMTALPYKRLTIMPGAGVNLTNMEAILRETGCTEIHASARVPKTTDNKGSISMGGGAADLEPLMVSDGEIVKKMVEILNSVYTVQ